MVCGEVGRITGRSIADADYYNGTTVSVRSFPSPPVQLAWKLLRPAVKVEPSRGLETVRCRRTSPSNKARLPLTSSLDIRVAASSHSLSKKHH